MLTKKKHISYLISVKPAAKSTTPKPSTGPTPDPNNLPR